MVPASLAEAMQAEAGQFGLTPASERAEARRESPGLESNYVLLTPMHVPSDRGHGTTALPATIRCSRHANFNFDKKCNGIIF